ncbi:sensor histidine kinase [Luteimonas chenhongjianii]|nr:PAS domain S-box protein [Luteimonas chenhongjianii]
MRLEATMRHPSVVLPTARQQMKLSRFIQENMDELLSEWNAISSSYAPSGSGASLGLGRHAEQILSAIAVDMETGSSETGQQAREGARGDITEARGSAAAVYGAVRHGDDLSVSQLAADYRALRATVLKAWLQTGEPRDAERSPQILRFNDTLDQAFGESLVAYDAQARRQRAKSQAALRESEARYRGIVNTALDYAIFTTDAAGIIESWPPGAEAVFGWTPEEAIGKHAEITFTEEDRAAGVPAEEMRVAQAEGVAADVRWHACRDGSRVFIDGATRPLIDACGDTSGFLKVGRDTTERKHWDERQQVLLRELQHRTRNLMAVVLTIFDKTRRSSPDVHVLAKSYTSRLGALARVQGLLSRLQEGDRIAFDTLVRAELSAMGALDEAGNSERVELSGPSGVYLRSGTVQTFALALHELATNALKYGALAQEQGRLSLRWRAMRLDGHPSLHIEWTESCVDMARAADAPHGSGYGRELIEYALPYQLDARTSYELGPDGVRCTIEVPVSDATSPDVMTHG